MKTLINLFFLSAALVTLSACKHPPTVYSDTYPADVQAIFEQRCATAGCHNEASFSNAGGLRLDNWQHTFEGANSGATIVPYDIKNSSLLYFVNTDSNEGPALLPRMPLNASPLSAAEYQTLKQWIAAGAPDKNGNIPFAANPETRQKFYISQQGCDLIAVVDAASGLIMRYIDIGMDNTIEVPHCVRFSPKGDFAYVSFTQGQYLQKIDAASDKVVGSLLLGDGSWNLFQISDDGKQMLVTDFVKGQIKLIDLQAFAITDEYEDFVSPHGIAANAAFDTFYITSQYGNTVYRLTKKGGVRRFSIDENEPNFLSETLNPHEIIMSPDRSKYFLSCQASNEVRVMDAKTNTLLKVIPVGAFPQEFALSKKHGLLFVSCEEENAPEYPGYRGAVYVIDYNTLELVRRIPGPFYQIHGIAVDEQNDQFVVASRNLLTTGPAPHHTSQCGGRNGYYNIYDLNTFMPKGRKRYESTVDPYSAATRFKD